MKKDDFTEEELKALYSGFLDRNCEPAPEAVSEAYTAISKAQKTICVRWRSTSSGRCLCTAMNWE